MKKSNDEIMTYNFPIVIVFQGALLIVPLLIADYVITTKYLTYMLPVLYSVAMAGWLLTLGNGRLSLNIERCKYVVDISKLKWKHWFVITSAKENCLSKVDFYYQIVGYFMIPFGILLSIVVLHIQKRYNITTNWISFDNIYTSIFLSFIILLFLIGTVTRILFLIFDALWYKKREKN